MSSGRAFHKVGALCENALYPDVLRLHLGTIKSFFLEDLRYLLVGLLVECGKKWKIVRKILPNSAVNSAEKSEIVRENAK